MNDIDMEAFDKDKDIKGKVKESIDELHALLVKAHVDRVSKNIHEKLIKMQAKIISQYEAKFWKFGEAIKDAQVFILNILEEKNDFSNEMQTLLGSLDSYKEVLDITRYGIALSKEEEDLARRLNLKDRDYAKHKKTEKERR